MHFDNDIYHGYIMKGDLHGAISYVKQFPEQKGLYHRFLDIFERELYISYDVDTELNNILTAYQQYYRDVFYLRIANEQAENKLKERLAKLLGITDEHIELWQVEENYLCDLFANRGLHFLGGRTSGYRGPYIWRTTETVSYDVELPDGIQNYSVKILDGFVMRSWIDYLSFGEIGTSGWANGDGFIHCVKSAWDFESESFRVSLLKHEAQHAKDLEMDKDMPSENLEYRAKLIELIYSKERNLLQKFAGEADGSLKDNGHAMAAYRIMNGFADALGVEEIQPAMVSIDQIQTIAKVLFEDSIKNVLTMRRNELQIKIILSDADKEVIARTILESLPDWFGIPESTEKYIADSKGHPFFCAYADDAPIGFLYLKETGRHTMELAVMGVLKEHHRQGVGRKLFMEAKNEAKRLGYSFIQVKTVQMGRYDIYDDTNRFYLSLGFKELEVFPTLWDECNPCQIYIMAI